MNLNFHDDKSYFEKACSQDIWSQKPKKKYKPRKKRKTKEELKSLRKYKVPRVVPDSDSEEGSFLKFSAYLTDGFRIKEESHQGDSILTAGIKKEPWNERFRIKQEPRNEAVVTFVPKIRIKSAYELGSSIVFVELSPGSAIGSKFAIQPALSDLIASDAAVQRSAAMAARYNIQTISNLYREFFTKENQTVIKKVAEVLQNLSENIERKNEKLTAISNSRSTDAEKLLMRCQAHSEFSRVKEVYQGALRQQFEEIGRIFEHENFEILFQLFFLGILKACMLMVSNKKGTVFKKIISLLSQSLASSNYKNDRVFGLLKSNDFRADCIALVHFIEKYSDTQFFDMLLISEVDKMKILSVKSIKEPPDISKSSFSFLSTHSRIPSVVKYAKGMNILPVGSNLLRQQPSQFKTEIKKKKSVKKVSRPKVLPVFNNTLSPPYPVPPASNQLLPESGSHSVPTLPPSVPNYAATSTIPESSLRSVPTLPQPVPNYVPTSTIPTQLSCPPYSIQHTIAVPPVSTFYSAMDTVPSSAPTTTSCVGSCTFSGTQNSNSFSNQIALTSGSSYSHTNPIFSMTSQSALSRSTVPLPRYPTVPSSTNLYGITSLPPVIPTNQVPNVVLSAAHTNNRPHSVIVRPEGPMLGGNDSIVPSSVCGGSGAAQGMYASVSQPSALSIQTQSTSHTMTETTASGYSAQNPINLNLLPVENKNQNGSVSQSIRRPSSTYCGTSAAPQGMYASVSQPSALSTQSQSASHTMTETTTSGYSAQNSANPNLLPENENQNDSASQSTSRTYSGAKHQINRHMLPPVFSSNPTPPRFYPAVCTNNQLTSTTTEVVHHFTAPGLGENGVASGNVPSSTVALSTYRTISPAGNSENIQPSSPHSLLPSVESGARMKDASYSVCPTTSANDGLTLRTLLSDGGRAPLVNQNGGTVISDLLVSPNLQPMANYATSSLPC